MKNFFTTKRVAAIGILALLIAVGVWTSLGCNRKKPKSVTQTTEQGVSPTVSAPAGDQKHLCRLARSGLRRVGYHDKPASVVFREQLPDGSYRVDIMLENGRTVCGRYYRDRKREKIAVDETTVYSHEVIIHERK